MTAGGNSFKHATAHKVNLYYTLAFSYCTFCVGKHTILGSAANSLGVPPAGGYIAQSIFIDCGL